MPGIADEYLRSASLASNRIRDVFEVAGIKTQITREGGRGRQACVFGFHSFRHSFVSLCHAALVPQTAVMEMVGHNSAAVHAIYQHADDTTKRAGIGALRDIMAEVTS